MSHIDRSYERLALANPNPTVEVVRKLTADEMLSMIEAQPPVVEAQPFERLRPSWRSGALVAAAVFVAVVVLIPVILLLTRATNEEPPVVTDPPTTTTIAETIAPPPTSTTEAPGSTTSAPAIDVPTQAAIDRFVDIYNAGDVEDFMAFLAPDFRREVRRDRDDTIQTLETVRVLYEIDAALNTELTLFCRLNSGSLQCDVFKFNDLNRVLGNSRTRHWTSILEFESFSLLRWFENRLNVDTDYDAQIRPFMDWVRENRPDVGELSPFVAGDWVVREGIAEEIAGLVQEWAASLGVPLESSTTTTEAPTLDAATQANVDRFVEIYNSGDVDAFLAFLAPDFRREFTQGSESFPFTLDSVQTLFEIEAALNAEVTLSCLPDEESAICETLIFSDLNRAMENPPRSDWDWKLTFEDGLLVLWSEERQNFDTLYRAQIQTFMAWVRENHPEVGELRPIVPLDWITTEGIAEEIATLVDEWAVSRGVTLEQ